MDVGKPIEIWGQLLLQHTVIMVMATKGSPEKDDELVRKGHDRVFQRMLFFSHSNEAYPIVKTKKSDNEDRLLYGRTEIDRRWCLISSCLMLPPLIVAHKELKCCSNNAVEPLRAAYNQADKGSDAR